MPSSCGGDWKSKVSPQIRKTLTAPWVPLGEVVDDDAVLCEHDVALDRKLVELVDDLDSPLPRVVGERPELGRVDDDLVPEPKQLGADRDEVNLGASGLVHQAVRQDEAHIEYRKRAEWDNWSSCDPSTWSSPVGRGSSARTCATRCSIATTR